jgi:nucleoside-diphosphate-sugar epimerase
VSIDQLSRGKGKTALVVGGTGPTGPGVVRELLERGYETMVFHGGTHEVPLPTEVRHIHGDPHFPETIYGALGDATFDVVVAQYGRLRHLTDHFRHRTGHLVAIGGAFSPLALASDPRWGPMGRPAIVHESRRHLVSDIQQDKLGFRIAEAAQAFLAAGEAGDFRATYIAYSSLFGPRQPASNDWAIVRRLLDGRRTLILPDGGLKLESRAYVGNVCAAPLLALDKPEVSTGRSYVVTDRDTYTMRLRVEFIARHLGVEVQLIDIPFDLATPAHPLYRLGPDHRVTAGERIRTELGYRERFDTAEALAQTVDWLVSADREQIEEIELQLGDSFDYAFEDQLISWWSSLTKTAPRHDGTAYTYSHIYRHPVEPEESWRRI